MATESRITDMTIEELNNSELLRALEGIKRDIVYMELENFVFEDFLQKNDPKFLIGITNALQVSQKSLKIHFSELRIALLEKNLEYEYYRTHNNERESFSSTLMDDSSSTKTTLSRRTGISVRTFESPRNLLEQRVNLETRTEIAEKLCQELSQALAELKSNCSDEMKDLAARIEQWTMLDDEAIQSKEALHKFVNSSLVDPINYRIPTEKFIRHINEWIQNGMTLIGKIRLRLTALKRQHRSQKVVLNKKAELNAMLCPIDFEKLQTQKSKLIKTIDDKTSHLVALKKLTGSAARLLNQNQKKLRVIMQTYQQLVNDSLSIENHIARLGKEGGVVKNQVIKCKESIDKLKREMNTYVAPSTLDYANKKYELSSKETEKKFLSRQIFILKIKLANIESNERKLISIMNVSAIPSIF